VSLIVSRKMHRRVCLFLETCCGDSGASLGVCRRMNRRVCPVINVLLGEPPAQIAGVHPFTGCGVSSL